MKLFGRWPVAGSVALVSFQKLTRYFCDPDLTDAFIDNALPVAWGFQHNAVIIYGFNPMIAEILRRKNQKVSNSCREQLWHGQLAALWRDLVYAWRIWAEPAKSYFWQCAGDSFDLHRRQFTAIRPLTCRRCDESRAIQHQCRTVFYPEWGADLYPKCGTKTNPRADPQNSDYFNDKNVIFASAGPSPETQLDDIATYQDEFIIFSIARSAQALSARGIVPDIIFAADIQDLNIAFFDGLKADFYRCILTFIQSWKPALKS